MALLSGGAGGGPDGGHGITQTLGVLLRQVHGDAQHPQTLQQLYGVLEQRFGIGHGGQETLLIVHADGGGGFFSDDSHNRPPVDFCG